MAAASPKALAKWLLLVFAAAWLTYWLAFVNAHDVALRTVLFLPWHVGPAAVAAILVARSRSRAEAWLFLAAQVAAVGWTVTLVGVLFLRPDAQGGIALMLFPAAQFFALFIYAAVLLPVARFGSGIFRH